MTTREGRPTASSHDSRRVGLTADRETDVLICIARGTLDELQRRRLRSLLCEGVDWKKLRAMAARHKLLPLLYWHLRERSDEIPPNVLQELGRDFLDNTCRMLALTAELIAVVRELEEKGIPCIPYKGPALAAEAYGNIALRQAGDLDVVVHRRHLPRVREVLRSRGYLPEHRLEGAGQTLMERTLYHEGFYHPDGCTVEVHWAFTDKHLGFLLNLDTLEHRLATISVGNETLPTFSREDLLLILAVHGAKHRWDRLEWVSSVAEFLRSPSAPDWKVLLATADEFGSRRVLFLGLRMASEILEAPLPREIQEMVFRDPAVEELGAAVRQLLFTDQQDWQGLPIPPQDVFYLQLNDRRSDKLRFLLHRLTTPSQAKSWRGIHICGIYVPLHVLSRPFYSGRAVLAAMLWFLRPRRNAKSRHH